MTFRRLGGGLDQCLAPPRGDVWLGGVVLDPQGVKWSTEGGDLDPPGVQMVGSGGGISVSPAASPPLWK